MPKNIGRRTARTFFWIALVPTALAFVGWWAARDYDKRLEWVRHSRDVLSAIDDINLTATDAETSQRGFLLTADESYLSGYRQALHTTEPLLDRLRALVADNPPQEKAGEELSAALRAKLNELRSTTQLVTAGHREAALVMMRSGKGQQLMNTVRALAATMTAREQTLLGRRIAEQSEFRHRLAAVFISAVLVTALLLIWAQRLILRFAHERERAEAEVRSLNAELEERVASQTASLRQANENLKRSNEDLERFAWVATHDLQEPLRMVTSYVGLLAKRYHDRLDENANTYIGFATDGARRMRDLINDLLAYVRAGVDRPVLASIDCERLLAGVLYKLQPKIIATGAVVTHDPLPAVTSDEDRLSTVFHNLIDNALKFAKPDEPPRIHISAGNIERGWRFSFRDEGIGFDQAYAERILVIFQKLHGPDQYSGTGLGLAVSRRIVEGLGGGLWAESQPGAGATFFFTLPLSADATIAAAAQR